MRELLQVKQIIGVKGVNNAQLLRDSEPIRLLETPRSPSEYLTIIRRRRSDYLTISINTQVIIQNRALSLARYLGLSADNHLDGQNGRQ